MDSRYLRGTLPVLGCSVLLAGTANAQSVRSTFQGSAQDDRLGVSVGNAGDVNNDGINDIILGAPEDGFIFDLREGYARVLSGADLTPLFTYDGVTPAGGLGLAVDGAGRVNADAFGDVIVGAPFDGSNQAGVVRVLSGANGLPIWTITGGPNDMIGQKVSWVGDVNNDGRDDFMFGAPAASPNGPSSGFASVYSGANGQMLYTYSGSNTGDRVGAAIAGVGDLNNDGHDDFIVGSSAVGATVYSGQSGSPLFPTFTSLVADDVYGGTVAGIGDVNNDNVPDFAIGATQDGSIFTQAPGYVELRSGTNGVLLRTLTGDSISDRFGVAIDGAGDVNNDGFDDVIIGADQVPLSFAGYARVYSGADGSTLHTFLGDSSADHFGQTVAGLGDADGNGRMEFLIGASFASPGGLIKAGIGRLWESNLSGGGGGPKPCTGGTTFCVLSPNSAGAGASLSMKGSTSIGANDLELVSSGVPSGAIGIFFYGNAEVSTPFGNGTRCVGGSEVFRIGIALAPGGVATLPVNYDQTYGNGRIQAGQNWKFQHWFRDPTGGGAFFNLSNGLSLTFCE